MSTKRRFVSLVGVAALLALGAQAAPAHGLASPNQRVTIVFAGGYTGVTVATGAITAMGTVLEESTLNPDGTFFGTLTFTFPLGRIVAPFTGSVTSLTMDPVLCTGRFSTAGIFTIGGGTGLYAGVGGSGSFTEEGTFNSLPTPGGCDPEPFLRTLLVTKATATVTR